MYSPEELAEWVEKLAGLAEDADEVYALFNNNRDDFAPRSARCSCAACSTKPESRVGR